ncbi:MAG: hypothetical protein HBSAPP04_26520 [Ignavibacteriaceae bacterium]|nr:MAG: T9SS C-terminal target domain-containing protein [Chlorobiota bacterium]GJQ33813.1 MAG: hypothetical protein HBSAPP04_26520 [Ignavibacteriaceae bacterium]
MIKSTWLLAFLIFNIFITHAQQWLKVELDAPGGVYALWNSGDTLYAGHDSIFYYSFDAGNTWNRSARFPDVEYGITAIQPHNGVIYAGTSGWGVFRSLNNGDTWEQFSQGLTTLGAKEVSALALRDDTLYATTIGAGVYRRPLSGNGVWTAFNEGLPFSTSWNVNTISNLDGDLYAGAGANGYFYVNRKNTGHWQEIQFDQFNGEINGVQSFGKSNGKIVLSSHEAVYTSDDNGLTWTKHSFGIGLASTSSIVTRGEKIVVSISKAARFYIYYSIDNGVTWWRDDMQSGVVANSIVIAGGNIWCGRMDGLFYKPDTITGVEEDETPQKTTGTGLSVYPNPAPVDGTVTISVTGTGQHGSGVLQIYNIAGEKVYSAVIENTLTTKLSGFASGLYIVHYTSEHGSATQKLVIVR